MPQVHARLVAEFGHQPEIYDPDEAVAKGGAFWPEGVAARGNQGDLPLPRPRLALAGGPSNLERCLRGAEVTEALDRLEKRLGFTLPARCASSWSRESSTS